MKSFLMHRSPVWIRVRRMREKKIRILCTMLSLFLLFSACGAKENSIAWHIGLSSASQIETVRLYEGYSMEDVSGGVIRTKSADITKTAEGKRYADSLFSVEAKEIPAPEAASGSPPVKGVVVFALKTDNKSVYQKITIRVMEKDEKTVTVQAELNYSDAERLRRMEEEDYSLADERWFVLSTDDPLFDPEYIEVFVKENTK